NMPVALNGDSFVDITENTFTHLASNASIRTPTNYSFDNATLSIKSGLPADRMTVQIKPSSESEKNWQLEKVEANSYHIRPRPITTPQRLKPTLASVQKLIRDIQVKTNAIANDAPNENSSQTEIEIRLDHLFTDDTTASAESRVPTSSLPLKIQINFTSQSDEN
ncbi:MAG: hypothetical protein ACPGPS_21885, partial [Rubripirellula sp.]